MADGSVSPSGDGSANDRDVSVFKSVFHVCDILIGNAIYTAVCLSSLATTNKAPSKVNQLFDYYVNDVYRPRGRAKIDKDRLFPCSLSSFPHPLSFPPSKLESRIESSRGLILARVEFRAKFRVLRERDGSVKNNYSQVIREIYMWIEGVKLVLNG